MEQKINNQHCSTIQSKLKTTTISTAYNICLQFTLRIISFIINAFILRFITKETLGIINVRLLLLYTTIQFITREPFRRTCSPNNSIDDDNDNKLLKLNNKNSWSSVVNITFLSIPLSFISGFIFSLIWYKFFDKPENLLIYEYQWAIMSIYVSVIIESLSETLFIYGQRYDYIRLKVMIEAIFQTVRCLLLAIFVYISPEHSIFGYALAQLVASTIYTISYYVYFLLIMKIPFTKFLPKFLREKNGDFDLKNDEISLLKTSLTFLYNSLLKQFLTEGERYIMTMFSVINFAEQGVYDVINNLGSLPARIIFQQIEENGYILFSSLIKRDIDASQQTTKILQSLSICSNLTKLMSIIAMTLFIYGYHAASIVLFIYGGKNFLDGPYGTLAIHLFQWHCIYIIFIAINGILESYSFAVMNTRQLNRFNTKLLLTSIIFTIVSLIITSYIGSIGFIVANCLNMLTRIIISLLFIGNIYPNYTFNTFISKTRPNIYTIISYIIIFIVLSFFYHSLNLFDIQQTFKWTNIITFIIINAIIGICHLICLYIFFENELCLFIRNELLHLKKSLKK